MSERIDTALVLNALSMASLHRNAPTDLLFHSDRGVQYTFSGVPKSPGQRWPDLSMSRKGNCYDNAFIESFWSTLKMDLVYRRNYQTRKRAQTEIFDYIEVFYNRQHSHTSLGSICPVDFELKNN